MGNQDSPENTESNSTFSPFEFTNVADELGVVVSYYGSPSPEHYMTGQNGGGVALADLDRDGRLDLFFTNGSHFDRPATTLEQSQQLFRLESPTSARNITSDARLVLHAFGMGCTAGDYDNDGFPDLFIAGYGRDTLWHNEGDGTFSRVDFDPDRDRGLWGTSAAFADLDADGFLDLYVADYVDYSPDDPPCFTQHHPPIQIPCGPIGRTGQQDRLYANLGDGGFLDASDSSGIAQHRGKGLGVCVVDLDGDGLLDIYVANDTTPNLLFRNLGAMQFEEAALRWGAAVSATGRAASGMGVASADVNQDGLFDLFVTNFDGEPNDLLLGIAAAGMRPANDMMGLDPIFRPMLGFGALFADWDLDQAPDLFVANGHVWDLRSASETYQYAMRPQVLANVDGHDLVDVSPHSGAYFNSEWVGRGAACGDLDNDGDPDLVITHLIEPAAILRNDSHPAMRGCRLTLEGRWSARTPLGVRVDYRIGNQTWTTRLPAGDSFQSSSDPRLIVVVDDEERIDELNIHWPGMAVESLVGIDLRGIDALRFRQGENGVSSRLVREHTSK